MKSRSSRSVSNLIPFCKGVLNKYGPYLAIFIKYTLKVSDFYTFVIVHIKHCFIIMFRHLFPLAVHPDTCLAVVVYQLLP